MRLPATNDDNGGDGSNENGLVAEGHPDGGIPTGGGGAAVGRPDSGGCNNQREGGADSAMGFFEEGRPTEEDEADLQGLAEGSEARPAARYRSGLVCVYRAGVICVNVYTVYYLSVDLLLQFLRCRGLDNRDLLYLPLPKSLLIYIYSNLSFIFFFVQMNRVAVATGLVGAILTVSGLAPVQRITMQPPVLGM